MITYNLVTTTPLFKPHLQLNLKVSNLSEQFKLFYSFDKRTDKISFNFFININICKLFDFLLKVIFPSQVTNSRPISALPYFSPGSHLCRFLHKGQHNVRERYVKKLHKCDQRHKKKRKFLCTT